MRQLASSDLRGACATLALAFDEDPLYRFMLPGQRRRRRWLEIIMANALNDAIPEGMVYSPGDGPEAGVASWFPPNTYPPPPGRGRRFLFSGDQPRVAWPTWRLFRRGMKSLREMARVHPHEPHYYLQCLGVHPDTKGRGLGRALVDHGLEHADRDGVPAYLETSNEANLGYYDRFGFDIVERLNPGGGAPPIWTMVRAPK